MEFLNKYPGIRLATQADSDRLQKFFAETPMDTDKLVLTYIREPDFFTFLTYQGNEIFVFCSENEKEEISGVATLTIREGYVNEKTARIGYLSDLRVKRELMSKNFSKVWKECMGELILKIKEIPELKCDYLITAIMAGNKAAKKSLVNQPKNKFHYEKLCNYRMVSIVTAYRQLPFSLGMNVSRCTDMSEVLDFLEKENQTRQFGFTRKFIQKAIINWPGLDLNSFIKVEKNGKILGMCATWNPSPTKKIIFEKLPLGLKLLNFMASFITKTPKEGKELEVQYLNFLVLKEKNALAAIINFLRAQGVFKQFHLLGFVDYAHAPLKGLLRHCILDETKLELYQVVSKEHIDDIVKLDGIPGFEISLV